MKSTRNILVIAIAFNAVIVLLEIWAIGHGFGRRGLSGLMYYTTLSNVFGLFACTVCLVAEIRALRGGHPASKANELYGGQPTSYDDALRGGLPVPHAVKMLKYSASCCLLMTLFVVVFVLAPAFNRAGYNGYQLMFLENELLVTHLLGPVLVFASYVLFEANRVMTFRQSVVGFLPTLAYAAVAYPCNIARIWAGPYPFFLVWDMPVWQSIAWFFALCALAAGLCQIPRLVGRVCKVFE